MSYRVPENDALAQDIADTIKIEYHSYEIEVLIKIYRWTKAEKDKHFFIHILKRIYKYKKALKRFKSDGFISLVKSKEPYRINRYGYNTGRAMLELKERGFL